MGFLIFALRKLMLRREINQKQSRLVCLTHDIEMQKKQMSVMQQAMAETKNMTQMFMQNTASIFDQMYSSQYQKNSSISESAMRKYNEMAATNPKDARLDGLKVEMENAANQTMENNRNLVITAGATKHALMGMNYAIENVYDTVDKAQINAMAAKETTMELEKESLESDIAVLQADYKANKDAEMQSAKDIAPNLTGGS